MTSLSWTRRPRAPAAMLLPAGAGSAALGMGRRVLDAVRRAARKMARGGEGEAAPPVEQAGGADVFGTPDFMDWFAGLMVRPDVGRTDIAARRADAAIEDQKASAPCECCLRPMPAAGRCAECRANGVWYCAVCHDRLGDLNKRRLNAAAEDRKASAPCDGCGRPMQAADRCGECRSMGLWFCDACHDRLSGLAARRIAGR